MAETYLGPISSQTTKSCPSTLLSLRTRIELKTSAAKIRSLTTWMEWNPPQVLFLYWVFFKSRFLPSSYSLRKQPPVGEVKETKSRPSNAHMARGTKGVSTGVTWTSWGTKSSLYKKVLMKDSEADLLHAIISRSFAQATSKHGLLSLSW